MGAERDLTLVSEWTMQNVDNVLSSYHPNKFNWKKEVSIHSIEAQRRDTAELQGWGSNFDSVINC